MSIPNPDAPCRLLCVAFNVRPKPAHPIFYDWETGLLSVWLFAASTDEATGRADRIVAELMYEVDYEKGVYAFEETDAAEAPFAPSCRAQAKQLGVAFSLHAERTGGAGWSEEMGL